jgi:hypothetical protein
MPTLVCSCRTCKDCRRLSKEKPAISVSDIKKIINFATRKPSPDKSRPPTRPEHQTRFELNFNFEMHYGLYTLELKLKPTLKLKSMVKESLVSSPWLFFSCKFFQDNLTVINACRASRVLYLGKPYV